MPMTSCRFFNGYKPCSKSANCNSSCAHLDEVDAAVLIIHLGALGAVVRSTSLLAAMKRKHPRSKIIWVTETSAAPLLAHNDQIDLVVSADNEGILSLKAFEFDTAYVIDKSLKAVGILSSVSAKKVFGFVAHPKTGAILPATEAAQELWELGLDNHKKFFLNTKSECQLVHEALELEAYQRDDYYLPLTAEENILAKARHNLWSAEGRRTVIGVNTGCSAVIPYKKLSVEFQRRLCETLSNRNDVEVVLLGGREDSQRNEEISKGLNVVKSSTEEGLRDGLISVAACDIVVTGDSLGMHLAISQKKWVVAWFGPTCAHEIELYGRGEKVLTQAPCAPCWKRSCQKPIMCYDQVDFSQILSGIEKGIEFCQKQNKKPISSFRLLSSEISS
jgi:heptosyltransferase-2